MQTEVPYWLEEAYKIPGVHIDVGIASRTLRNWIGLALLFDDIGLDCSANVIDYGGAPGLLARLMRDYGYNMRAYDKYAPVTFTNYFITPQPYTEMPEIITAFEVFEHFANPMAELEQLVSAKPYMIIFSTGFWEEQGENWDYLVPSCGQHVFFYTERALFTFFAERQYELIKFPFFHAFLHRYAPPAFRRGAASACAKGWPPSGTPAARIIQSVIFGNEFIQADAAAALQKFEAYLHMDGNDLVRPMEGKV
ncbi:hypothetical protein A1351_21400 [Methylosinus sp. R-45379]|nr:hypothetical protein A1351_21400 [Methylosinus sp. R-45379]